MFRYISHDVVLDDFYFPRGLQQEYFSVWQQFGESLSLFRDLFLVPVIFRRKFAFCFVSLFYRAVIQYFQSFLEKVGLQKKEK